MPLEVIQTGGSCTALMLRIPNTEMFVLITQGLSAEIEAGMGPVEVGVYVDMHANEPLAYGEFNIVQKAPNER
jgi:hypothetical protein